MLDGLMAHFRHLEKLLRRRGRTREDTEDLIQETFLRVKQYLDDGGQIREPEAFLTRTALNLSRDTRKSESRYRSAQKSLEDLLVADTAPSAEEEVQTQDQIRRVKRALNHAGPRAKEIFLLHRLHGMSYMQLADHFDLSQSTIEKYIARAIAALSEERLKS
jgi:RNA polymerase sigma factor (sigma-70 family)